MELKVKHDELNEVVKTSDNNSLLLRNEIDRIVKEIDNLKQVWQGIDADNFYGSVYNYLVEMKKIPAFYDDINQYIYNVDKNYRQIDDEYANNLKRLGDLNE